MTLANFAAAGRWGVLPLLAAAMMCHAGKEGALSEANEALRPKTLVSEELTTIRYRGIRPTDPNGRCGLRNPERGFRTETIIAEPTGRTEGVWGIPAHLWNRVGPGFSQENWLADFRRHEPEGVTLTQAYCYLTEYHDRPISAEKLSLIQRSFDAMREAGVKCVLRFAYIKEYPPDPPAPDTDRILQHIEQLRPLIRRNIDVIHTFEAGFIAAWGEWHVNAHILDPDQRARVLRRLLDVVPPDRMIQVRCPGFKVQLLPKITGKPFEPVSETTAFSGLPVARIGHHDDGMLTYPREMNVYVYGREPVEFGDLTEMVEKETNFVPMGGELFWADMAWFGPGTWYRTFPGLEAARNLWRYHYNVFSLAHSYSEREGKLLSIDRWREEVVTPEILQSNRLPVASDWFTTASGEIVPRTMFEYIRDHLGYRIELSQLTFTRRVHAGGNLGVELTLRNAGFSTLFHARPVHFVLLDGDGKMTVLPRAQVDVRRWYPHDPSDPERRPLVHRISYECRLPRTVKPGFYSLGLWLPDASPRLRHRADYAIRVANGDVPFWVSPDRRRGGVNLLAAVEVVKASD